MIIAPSAKAIWQHSTDKSAFVVLWDTARILRNPGGAHDQVGWYWGGRSMPMWQTHWLYPPTGPETALSYWWLQTHLALVLPPAPLAEGPVKSHSFPGPQGCRSSDFGLSCEPWSRDLVPAPLSYDRGPILPTQGIEQWPVKAFPGTQRESHPSTYQVTGHHPRSWS